MGGFLFLFYFIFLSVFGWMEKKINGGAYMFGHDSCLTMFGHMVEETRQLGSCLELCSFDHVKRKGNKLAHSLVHRAVLCRFECLGGRTTRGPEYCIPG